MAEPQTSGLIAAYVLLNGRTEKPRFVQCSLCCRHNQKATRTSR